MTPVPIRFLPSPPSPPTGPVQRDGGLVLAKDGTRYRLIVRRLTVNDRTFETATIQHEMPKVRGKAARRDDKRRRRAARTVKP